MVASSWSRKEHLGTTERGDELEHLWRLMRLGGPRTT
jgi:hypothetical protein